MILPYVLSLSKLGQFRLDDLLESDQIDKVMIPNYDEFILAVHDLAITVEVDLDHLAWKDVYQSLAWAYETYHAETLPPLDAFIEVVMHQMFTLEVTHV